ncbi:MAG: hypothetical protein KC766_12330 [Myxococcales bacterium]|nr:hypothetical protein [Myxococcales bacterium]
MNRAWLRRALVLTAMSCALVACGSDDSGGGGANGGAGGSGNNGSGATGGSGNGGSSGSGTNGGAAGSGATGGNGGSAAGGSSGNAGTGNTGNCPGAMAWEVTYDLTGSVFEISGTPFKAGDQKNVVQKPYDADDHWGPATMVIRFTDAGGTPGDGAAQIVSYTARQDFVVNATGTAVHTALDVDASPTGTQCGTAEGSLASDTLSFGTDMRNYHTKGAITCTGSDALCKLANPRDVDETKDQALNSFTFTNGVAAFKMEKVDVPNTDNATTELSFIGTETGRTQVCACE